MADRPTSNRALTGGRTCAANPRSVIRSEHLAIAAGGIGGAYLRVLVNELIGSPGNGWPWATFLVNVVGTLLLGYFMARLLERLPPSTYRRPLLGTGFCGALTTFSTMQLELLTLLRNGHAGMAAAYATGSTLAGFAAFMAAIAVVRRARVVG